MFGNKVGEQCIKYFQRLKRQQDEKFGAVESNISADSVLIQNVTRVSFLNFAIEVAQRHQTVIPGVGTLHGCCEYVPIFTSLARQLMYTNVNRKKANKDGTGKNLHEREENIDVNRNLIFTRELTSSVHSLHFYEYTPEEAAPHRNAYSGVMNTLNAFYTSERFTQLNMFINRFSYLLRTSFEDIEFRENGVCKRAKIDVPVYGRHRGTLELFQKMMLMHATYFIASVLLGDHIERVEGFLSTVFDIPICSSEIALQFKQRSTVFLVPRRHGKTWFIVSLIALLMSTFRGIKVGYTAHIRKATEPVFEEIKARLEQWFGTERIEHVKGESITFSFSDGCCSTAVFSSSHNTNGIRGQTFNLLFVDEANFIRPDAVQTIVGFLNQTNCKIIFVSSTNTGKASTSFLYNLRNSSDRLLNVVTYVCDDHMSRVLTHNDITACSCYVLNKPVFITMDGSVRQTADLFMADSFMQELVGGHKRDPDSELPIPLFTKTAMDRFVLYRPSTVLNCERLAPTLYIYIDPAFTTNVKASGTGVAIVGRYKLDFIIFGLEHFYLRALTGTSSNEIGRCVVQCLAHVLALHPSTFSSVCIAVEGNSSQDSAVAIVTCIIQQYRDLEQSDVLQFTLPSLLFYHCIPPGSQVAYPFFLLQKQKTLAVDYFVKRFNSGNIIASQEIVSLTVRLGTDPVDYLCKQLNNLTELVKPGAPDRRSYTGKCNGSMSDDMMVALLMAVYIGGMETSEFSPLYKPIK
ncbi:unknown [Cercopithecine alphaherpesvirus 9]|uniref:Terminase large subunit n=1 Tax=Cercopithecine herpesvirus 9 (strain DHV) TaxID=36348 RepID=Q9E1X7_CHV9D|nr:DNA packaging terminase subunit 1 [Cercopithecine alphaherpesvirus 9]AAG27219.1 unknown [Cercopithecine alphaherpesvirus 9]